MPVPIVPARPSPLWIAVGLVGFLGVAAGALGFHALGADATLRERTAVDNAVTFHMIHVLAAMGALILLGRWPGRWPDRLLTTAAGLFLLGILLFSGSVYARLLGAPDGVGSAAPIGGSCFFIGWLMLGALGLMRTGPPHRPGA